MCGIEETDPFFKSLRGKGSRTAGDQASITSKKRTLQSGEDIHHHAYEEKRHGRSPRRRIDASSLARLDRERGTAIAHEKGKKENGPQSTSTTTLSPLFLFPFFSPALAALDVGWRLRIMSSATMYDVGKTACGRGEGDAGGGEHIR